VTGCGIKVRGLDVPKKDVSHGTKGLDRQFPLFCSELTFCKPVSEMALERAGALLGNLSLE